jgi:putative ABC transport system permease protein
MTLQRKLMATWRKNFMQRLKSNQLLGQSLITGFQVIHYLRPFAVRKKRPTILYYDMFQNYFKISWRSLIKQKMYSGIKIGGLAIGIAACFLISLYVRDEVSYDKHVTHGDRIYRLVAQIQLDNGKLDRSVDFPAPTAAVIENDFPEVEENREGFSETHYSGAGENEVRRSDRAENMHEGGFAYFDQKLIELLDLRVLAGSLKHALTEPNSIVITQRKAEKYFPGEDAIGKTFIINNDDKNLFKVGAVIENFPIHSHLQADFLKTLTDVEFWRVNKPGGWPAITQLTFY